MSARTVMRGVAFLGATALLASLAATPAASAAPLPASEPLAASEPQASLGVRASDVTPSSRSIAPRGFWEVGFFDVLDKGLAAYDLISNCIENQKANKPCTAQPTLNDVINKLDLIQAQIQANQQRTEALLQKIIKTVNTIEANQFKTRLETIEVHIPRAIKAWKAIQVCQKEAQLSGNAKCHSYVGVRSTEMVLAEDAIQATLGWMNDKAAGPLTKLDLSVPGTTKTFEGFSAALWKQIKADYDASVGASATATRSPRVLTHQLTEAWNPVFKEWIGLMYAYGFFVTMKKHPTEATKATQTDVNRYIFGPEKVDNISSVPIIADRYQLPSVPVGSVVFLKGGKAYKIKKPGTPDGAHLTSADMVALGDAIKESGYFASQLSAKDIRFVVRQPVFERAHPYYSLANGKKVAVCASSSSTASTCYGPPSGEDAPKAVTHELSTCTPETAGTLAGNRCIWGEIPMTVTDSRLTWADEAKLYSPSTLEKWTYGTWYKGSDSHGYFDVSFEKYVVGRAIYDWDTLYFSGCRVATCNNYAIGPGVYVKHSSGTSNRLVELTRDKKAWVPDMMK